MELVFFAGNLLTLAILATIVALGYRMFWKALVVVTPAGDQVVDLFADDDPSQEFWLHPSDGKARRVGAGITVGSDAKCDLHAPGEALQFKLLPYRDWCAVQAVTAVPYAIDDLPTEGNSLLKEGQCLTIGDLSIQLTRRPL